MGALAAAGYRLPAELDTYLQESIFHMLGMCSKEDQLNEDIAKAKEVHLQLMEQVQQLQLRVEESELKWSQSKEEAALNAHALKRQVEKGQKLTEQCRALKRDFEKLEKECSLYHNDRDVFMEAAYEAEDRAAVAEDRALEAEERICILVAELDKLKHVIGQDSRTKLEVIDTDCVDTLKARFAALQKFETQTARATVAGPGSPANELFTTEARWQQDPATGDRFAKSESAAHETEPQLRQQSGLETGTKTERETTTTKQNEQAVHEMVTTAVCAGICKAFEEEKQSAIATANEDCGAILRHIELELCASRDRAKFAEKNVQALLSEVHALRQEAALCKGNLDKAEVEVRESSDFAIASKRAGQQSVRRLADQSKELKEKLRCSSKRSGIRGASSKKSSSSQLAFPKPQWPYQSLETHEVQMLADENKELRLLLRRRYLNPDAALQNKGINNGGSRRRLKENGLEMCITCNTRQPLKQLSVNSTPRKARRQNLTVDGNSCGSPSSPSSKGVSSLSASEDG